MARRLVLTFTILCSLTAAFAARPADADAPALVAYYPLDADATDHSGNGHHGSQSGGSFTTGYKLGGYAPDGGTIALPIYSAVNVAPDSYVTVAFWMKWAGENSVMPFGWQTYDLWLVDGAFGFNQANSDVWGISSAGLAGDWHFVVAGFKNGNMHDDALWIDGVAQTLTQKMSSSGSQAINGDGHLSGWGSSGYRMCCGTVLDEVHVYNGLLSDAQVANLMASGSADPPTPTPELPTLALAGAGLVVAAVAVVRARKP